MLCLQALTVSNDAATAQSRMSIPIGVAREPPSEANHALPRLVALDALFRGSRLADSGALTASRAPRQIPERCRPGPLQRPSDPYPELSDHCRMLLDVPLKPFGLSRPSTGRLADARACLWVGIVMISTQSVLQIRMVRRILVSWTLETILSPVAEVAKHQGKDFSPRRSSPVFPGRYARPASRCLRYQDGCSHAILRRPAFHPDCLFRGSRSGPDHLRIPVRRPTGR
jgi:hypothetical protein